MIRCGLVNKVGNELNDIWPGPYHVLFARDRSWLFSVIVGRVFLCVIRFQADRDVLALAMQEQLDSYIAMKACKYCGRVVYFSHSTKPSRMYLLERADSCEMQTE